MDDEVEGVGGVKLLATVKPSLTISNIHIQTNETP